MTCEDEHNVQTIVRIKPPGFEQSSKVSSNEESIRIDRHTFMFDQVIGPEESQDDVYEKVGLRVISNVLKGYNGCILAYGQTGSGKTHTMTGTGESVGLVQKCFRTLWNCLKLKQSIQVKLQFFEIYNETIKDLLSERDNLAIREKAQVGFYVENLTRHCIEDESMFCSLLQKGMAARSVKSTNMNERSSRSHSVLNILVGLKEKGSNDLDVTRFSAVTFVDLAGSEKQRDTQVRGQGLKEAASINASLSNLSMVINRLSTMDPRNKDHSAHVPFRNSVLTKVLKSSLSGKSKVTIICVINSDTKFIEETKTTLRFAETAKLIRLKVTKNEEFSGESRALKQEIRRLNSTIQALQSDLNLYREKHDELLLENSRLRDEVQDRNLHIADVRNELTQSELATQFRFSNSQSVPCFSQEESCFLAQDRPAWQDGQSSFQTKSHYSDIFASPKRNKSFFTIDEVSENRENGKSQLKSQIIHLQKDVAKLKKEKNFLEADTMRLQARVSSLESEVQFYQSELEPSKEYESALIELVRRSEFSRAQMENFKILNQQLHILQEKLNFKTKHQLSERQQHHKALQQLKLECLSQESRGGLIEAPNSQYSQPVQSRGLQSKSPFNFRMFETERKAFEKKMPDSDSVQQIDPIGAFNKQKINGDANMATKGVFSQIYEGAVDRLSDRSKLTSFELETLKEQFEVLRKEKIRLATEIERQNIKIQEKEAIIVDQCNVISSKQDYISDLEAELEAQKNTKKPEALTDERQKAATETLLSDFRIENEQLRKSLLEEQHKYSLKDGQFDRLAYVSKKIQNQLNRRIRLFNRKSRDLERHIRIKSLRILKFQHESKIQASELQRIRAQKQEILNQHNAIKQQFNNSENLIKDLYSVITSSVPELSPSYNVFTKRDQTCNEYLQRKSNHSRSQSLAQVWDSEPKMKNQSQNQENKRLKKMYDSVFQENQSLKIDIEKKNWELESMYVQARDAKERQEKQICELRQQIECLKHQQNIERRDFSMAESAFKRKMKQHEIILHNQTQMQLRLQKQSKVNEELTAENLCLKKAFDEKCKELGVVRQRASQYQNREIETKQRSNNYETLLKDQMGRFSRNTLQAQKSQSIYTAKRLDLSGDSSRSSLNSENSPQNCYDAKRKSSLSKFRGLSSDEKKSELDESCIKKSDQRSVEDHSVTITNDFLKMGPEIIVYPIKGQNEEIENRNSPTFDADCSILDFQSQRSYHVALQNTGSEKMKKRANDSKLSLQTSNIKSEKCFGFQQSPQSSQSFEM